MRFYESLVCMFAIFSNTYTFSFFALVENIVLESLFYFFIMVSRTHTYTHDL